MGGEDGIGSVILIRCQTLAGLGLYLQGSRVKDDLVLYKSIHTG